MAHEPQIENVMACQFVDVTVNVHLANADALNAFGEGLALVREAAADLPWREDLQESLRCFDVAIDGLKAVRQS